MAQDNTPEKKKRTITEILDSKKTGEKMVYMSVPDYTSARMVKFCYVFTFWEYSQTLNRSLRSDTVSSPRLP